MASGTSGCNCLDKKDYPGFQHKTIWEGNFYQAIDSMVGEDIELVCVDIAHSTKDGQSERYRDLFASVDAVKSSSGSVFIFCDNLVSHDIRCYADGSFGSDNFLNNISGTHNLKRSFRPSRPEYCLRRQREQDVILHYCSDISARKKFEEGWLDTSAKNNVHVDEIERQVFNRIVSKGGSKNSKFLIITDDPSSICIEADKSTRQWMSILMGSTFLQEMRMRFYSSKVRFRLLGQQEIVSDNSD